MLQFILCSSIFTIVVKPLNIFYQICFCSFFFFFSNFAIAVKFEYSVYKPYHKAAIVCQSVLYFEIGDHWGDQYCQIVVVLPCVYTFGTAAFSRKFLLQPSSCPCTPTGSRFRCFPWHGGDFPNVIQEISVRLLGTSSVY